MPRFLILGTGTAVGKTYVTGALLSALAERDLVAVGLKPIETGIRTSGDVPPPGSDAGRLEQASTTAAPRPHPLYAFPDPISPHLAARRAGASIEPSAIAAWCDTLHYAASTVVLVETAGGALSPIAHGLTNAELATALHPDRRVLVAPDSLGVLHDVTATLDALATRSVKVDVVALSTCRPPDDSTGTNADELRRLGIAEHVVSVGRDGTAEALLDALLALG